MLVLENGHALENRFLRNYRNSIRYRVADKYSYTQFWEPIAKVLDEETIEKVYLSPDGIYHQINLLTLQNPQTQKYLTDVLDLQLLGSPADLVKFGRDQDKLQKNFAAFQIHLYGYPQYDESPYPQDSTKKKDRSINLYAAQLKDAQDSTSRYIDRFGNISPLPGTKTEVERIHEISKAQNVSSKLFMGPQASEDNIKNIKDPNILHIATHGYFLENLPQEANSRQGFIKANARQYLRNPLLRCGLLLAGASPSIRGERYGAEDGIFTAEEALNLYLDNTELVVLSACETGLGTISNGEGVYGLQRAFQQAGAQTVLMSLWTVSDQATQELMIAFYQNLLEKKQSKRTAFRNAQRSLKEKYPEPYFWGAFVMVGE